MQPEEAVEVDRAGRAGATPAAGWRCSGRSAVVRRVAVRHDDVERVGRAALEEADERLAACRRRRAAPCDSSCANAVRRRKLGLSPSVTSASAPDFMKTRRCIEVVSVGWRVSDAGTRARRGRARRPGRTVERRQGAREGGLRAAGRTASRAAARDPCPVARGDGGRGRPRSSAPSRRPCAACRRCIAAFAAVAEPRAQHRILARRQDCARVGRRLAAEERADHAVHLLRRAAPCAATAPRSSSRRYAPGRRPAASASPKLMRLRIAPVFIHASPVSGQPSGAWCPKIGCPSWRDELRRARGRVGGRAERAQRADDELERRSSPWRGRRAAEELRDS